MFQITITGGKGGTGKSFVAVNLAVLLASKHHVVLADLDLEAPNDHVLLGIDKLENEEPIKLFLPFIDTKKCTRCGVCSKICDTGAILVPPKGFPIVFPRLCSGCSACYYACPYGAILKGYHILGHTYVTRVDKYGVVFTLVTGVLREGEEHVSPGVNITKKRALKQAREILLIDTSAGTGSHVSSALSGSKIAIIVTEPTPLGLHDMKSILDIAKDMGIEMWLVINRAGIGDDSRHVETARKYSVEKVFRIPYHRDAVESYVKGIPIVVYKPGSPVSKAIQVIHNEIEKVLEAK